MLIFLVPICLLRTTVQKVLNCFFLVVSNLVKEILAFGALVCANLLLTLDFIGAFLGPD